MIYRHTVSLTGFVAMLSLSSPAYAYIDPATGSIVLQAAIGTVAGAVLFLRTSLFRMKSFLLRRKPNSGE